MYDCFDVVSIVETKARDRECLPVQIVGYDRTPDAAILVADAGVIERVALESGREIAFSLGDRRCAGIIEGETHHPCTRPSAPHCPVHTETWVCARCRGTCLKAEMDCFEEHAVYLAMVAPDIPKVGVTRLARLGPRLHEQGADRGALIHRVANGRIAREIEAEIAETLPDRIPIGAKIGGLTTPIDAHAWQQLLAAYEPIEVFDPQYQLAISTPPVPETIACGRVLGTKGRLLVLELGGTTYVTDLRELVGHHVHRERANPDRQSGLEAFS